MFSGVVQHRYQHPFPPSYYSRSSHHLESHGINLPFSRAANYEDANTTPDPASVRLLQRPRQYAHPLRSPPDIPVRTNPPNPSSPRIDASEYMLRRKTPNGTLAAGYDGASVEWTRRPHAMKHILMPSSAIPQNYSNQGLLRGGYDSYLSANGSGVRADEQHHWSSSKSLISPSGTWDSLSREDVEGQINSLFPRKPAATSIDSILGQNLSSQPSYKPTMPTVTSTGLQPMWPPKGNPTISKSSGPYGLYSPSGSFAPYQSSPLYHPGSSGWYSAPTQIQPGLQDPFGQNYGPKDEVPFKVLSPVGTNVFPIYDSDYDINDHHVCFSAQEALTGPKRQMSTDYNRNLPEPTQLPYRGKSSQIRENSAQTDTMCFPSDISYRSKMMELELNVPADDLHYRENVLVWAHRIYINLLTYLHYTRKHAHGKNFSCRQPQACIYPRPRNVDPNTYTNTQVSEEILHFGKDQTSSRSETTINGQYPRPRVKDSIARHKQCYLDKVQLGPRQTIPFHSYNNHQQSPEHYRNSAGHVMFSPGHHVHSMNQPNLDARAALNVITKICQDGSWQWIEGLLLGGCLAYGLAEYEKALQWYSRVLSCDLNNVEAMSNMAATLLSLNRRHDAEQYWLRSVKVQPCYFEAVEHLIGLLCSDQRGKEAVKVIDFVENELRISANNSSSSFKDHEDEVVGNSTQQYAKGSTRFRGSTSTNHGTTMNGTRNFSEPGLSGYAIPPIDNGRMLALIHAKGNMLYALGDNAGAAKAFEDAILVGAGRREGGIKGLIQQILQAFADDSLTTDSNSSGGLPYCHSILLLPELALETAKLVFPTTGQLPGLTSLPDGSAKRSAISTTSNSLLSLAKIYQDGMSSSGATADGPKAASGVQDILALYYLSLSLQPSPSTANNVGILLASVQQSASKKSHAVLSNPKSPTLPGVVPGSGVALALAYYNYGLGLDERHAHLYTNLGSLLKDIGQLSFAIRMYEKAVECDGTFDIALANLANAVKDQGRISDAISYYRRAVSSNPEFIEAVCGLANARNSVCDWEDRGGVVHQGVKQDRWHVDKKGMLFEARTPDIESSGWIGRVAAIVERQLHDGESWGKRILHSIDVMQLLVKCYADNDDTDRRRDEESQMMRALEEWTCKSWEGAKVVRLVERATKRLGWQLYQNLYVNTGTCSPQEYPRPQLPPALAVPSAPTVLPFHTFTSPLSAKQIRKISQRNGLRISCSTLRAPWLPANVYHPPAPPRPSLNVGYVSSDFNNHPLAHLMQSVFGYHNRSRVEAFCYATTASDNSIHRQQIQREAPHFHDASLWSVDQLVRQIVDDGIHILINLNGYTRGARNEVFAARPAPIQMSFMGFAGTLGAEWCDYLLSDMTATPIETLRPWRSNIDLIDQTLDGNYDDDNDDWVYGENIIYTKNTFFCCDHRQSAPDSQEPQLDWPEEQRRRWRMRKELFPDLPDEAIILGNFNQLYKIEPTTFRTWLRILMRVPRAVLWLLRFPDLGEHNLRKTAHLWAGDEVASRIVFTDVAPKHQHISRARICDLFLDTPECNAHTTAADVLWSGTPLLTFPRYQYKMCSRMAASILKGALPQNAQGERAAKDLIVGSDHEYEERAVRLASDLVYGLQQDCPWVGSGRLSELRRLLYDSRWTCALFDTKRWVQDLETAYEEAWRRWVAGDGGDIWI